jgi:uncharacterized protein DUF4384
MLILLASLATAAAPAAPASADRPPLQIWMNNDRRFREGERARVQIDAEVDGFLLVLNYETDGRVRVLFPLDPRDDARVRAGRRYEVRDEGGESAFRAGQDGTGLIYSAIAVDPWRLDDVVLEGRWDYNRLSINRSSENPEAELTDLVQQLAGPGGFDYDVTGYRVYGASTSAYDGYYSRGPIYVYDDYFYCNSWYGCYNDYRWPYAGGWSLGFGYYGYRPYRYGYNPYYPYYPYYPHYGSGSGGRRPVIVGRPRSYTVFPQPGSNTASGPRVGGGTRGFSGTTGSAGSRGSTGSATTPPPINWRPRSVARPAGGRGPEVTRGSGERSVFTPPARRSRSEGATYPAARGGGEGSRGGYNAPARNDGERSRGGYNPPARSEPRSNPPAQRSPSGGGGNSGGGGGGGGRVSGGGGGGGGGHSQPSQGSSRPRRP